MNFFNAILSKILPHANAAATSAAAQKSSIPQVPFSPMPAAPSTATPSAPVDVNQILTGLAQKNSQKLNWQTSIVDLLKLLGLDSSLESRKQLAKELNYTGDMNDSAKMNAWLSHEVMTKLAQNGGQVPDSLKH